jgi:hypothetical protein
MILQNQVGFSTSGKPLKKKRSGNSADAATNDNTVINLASVDWICQQGIVRTVAHAVPSLQHFERVSV